MEVYEVLTMLAVMIPVTNRKGNKYNEQKQAKYWSLWDSARFWTDGKHSILYLCKTIADHRL
jgi:hypothetical protein